MKKSSFLISAGVVLFLLSSVIHAKDFKVLVVMSYEEDNPWCQEIRNGIDSVLAESSDIHYSYMDTKVAPKGGPAKAAEAYERFQELKPNGVITIDDNAQSMFVLPFLDKKHDVPVMFGGVNAKPDKYGYPNNNVSGILERAHVRESLAFAKQLLPDIKQACFMTNNVPLGQALMKQVESEKSTYPVEATNFYLLNSVDDLQANAAEINSSCDTVFVDSLEGVKDKSGKPMDNKQVLEAIANAFKGSILGGNRYQVEQGAWAAVIKTGQEQGESSAELLLKAMQGTPVKDIPVITNTKGQRIINVSALEKNNIKLKPLVMRGAILVK